VGREFLFWWVGLGHGSEMLSFDVGGEVVIMLSDNAVYGDDVH